jgi:hypothetical protein
VARRPSTQDRDAPAEAILVGGLAKAMPVVAPSTIGELVRARNWVSLCGETDGELVMFRLYNSVERSLEDLDDKYRIALEPWSSVLSRAGVPWMAWRIMDTDVDGAHELYEHWASCVAQLVSIDAVKILDEASDNASSKDDGPMVSASMAAATTRRWLAERLDPKNWAPTNKVVGAVAHRVEIVMREE